MNLSITDLRHLSLDSSAEWMQIAGILRELGTHEDVIEWFGTTIDKQQRELLGLRRKVSALEAQLPEDS
jgi:hypothetical protein